MRRKCRGRQSSCAPHSGTSGGPPAHLALDACRCGHPSLSKTHQKIAAARIRGLFSRELALCREPTHFFRADHCSAPLPLRRECYRTLSHRRLGRVVPVMINDAPDRNGSRVNVCRCRTRHGGRPTWSTSYACCCCTGCRLRAAMASVVTRARSRHVRLAAVKNVALGR
jgi:hypothetical protein